jgi:putative sterol carrier protein
METIETEVQVDVPARLEEIFNAFQTKGAEGADSEATFVFELEGEHGGRHLLKTGPDSVSWERDYAGEADVVVKLTTEDFLAIADGKFDGRLAVASERIELDGDRELAERMLGLIEPEDA